jgi:hypothetical protein
MSTSSRPVWFAVLAAGLGAVLVAAWWSGTDLAVRVLAGLLVLVALARAVLPDDAAGPLVVRSRPLDVVACLVLAVLLLVVTTLVPTGT